MTCDLPLNTAPQPCPGPAHGEAGFTLMEVLWTSAIALTAFTMLAGTIISLDRTRAASEYRQIAASICASVMDELTRADQASLLIYAPPAFSAVEVPYEVEVRYQNGANWLEPPLAANTVLPNPLTVEVTVTVNVPGARPMSYRSITLVRP